MPKIKNPLPAIEDEGSGTLALSSKALIAGLAGVSTSTLSGRLLRHHRASPSAALDKALIVSKELAEGSGAVNQPTTRSVRSSADQPNQIEPNMYLKRVSLPNERYHSPSIIDLQLQPRLSMLYVRAGFLRQRQPPGEIACRVLGPLSHVLSLLRRH